MTNMEALDMPTGAGVDTTAIIVGDYSNGNDAVLTRNGVKLKDLPGKRLLLVEKPSLSTCSSAPWPSMVWNRRLSACVSRTPPIRISRAPSLPTVRMKLS